MWNLLNHNLANCVLAQCSCGGGSERRISWWLVLIPVAAVVLGGFLYDVNARRKGRMIDTQESAEPLGDQSNRNT